MCSHTTGVCLNRPDFNLKRAPGLLTHEVPAKLKETVHVTLDMVEVRRRAAWNSQSLRLSSDSQPES